MSQHACGGTLIATSSSHNKIIKTGLKRLSSHVYIRVACCSDLHVASNNTHSAAAVQGMKGLHSAADGDPQQEVMLESNVANAGKGMVVDFSVGRTADKVEGNVSMQYSAIPVLQLSDGCS